MHSQLYWFNCNVMRHLFKSILQCDFCLLNLFASLTTYYARVRCESSLSLAYVTAVLPCRKSQIFEHPESSKIYWFLAPENLRFRENLSNASELVSLVHSSQIFWTTKSLILLVSRNQWFSIHRKASPMHFNKIINNGSPLSLCSQILKNASHFWELENPWFSSGRSHFFDFLFYLR